MAVQVLSATSKPTAATREFLSKAEELRDKECSLARPVQPGQTQQPEARRLPRLSAHRAAQAAERQAAVRPVPLAVQPKPQQLPV
jgi:hypothetical protein